MKLIRNRFQIASLQGGGILMTTVILLAGYNTPRVLRRFAKFLGYISERMNSG
jgi:hypothetical protein